MTYSPKVSRQAKRLGIVLPDDEWTYGESRWDSGGQDVLFEGPCKLSKTADGWSVALRRSRKRGGYRHLTTVKELDQAMDLAGFLRKPENRRAYRGTKSQEARTA